VLGASLALHLAAGTAAMALPQVAWWAVGAVALNHAAITAAGLWPRSSLLGPNITRLPAQAARRRQIAITFDDGPDPAVTPAVLDLLARHGALATFFCIGHAARSHPALVRRIVKAGHSVQNHSLHHRHNFSLLGPRACEREIGDSQALLADLTGQLPHAFRAPAGLRNVFLDRVLHRLDLNLVSWTRRGFDTRESRAQVVLQRLSNGLAAGDILLLHDGHSARTADGLPLVLQVLPRVLERCRDAGLGLVTLAEALPRRRGA
jgi:peptidoglycan/xylan/chitin deacetylase (PgdA/CDA1 family)